MRLLLPFTALLAIFTLTTACEVETEFLTGPGVELRFSTDTVTFDTGFTSRGSATRLMKVYNDLDHPVKNNRLSV